MFSFELVPDEKMALSGRFASVAHVISLLSNVFPSFPVVLDVELKNTIPADASVDEHFNIQYLRLFKVESFINLIVDVPLVEDVLLFVIVRSLVVPVAFKRPSMVTLSAPFRSISAAFIVPEIVLPVTVG